MSSPPCEVLRLTCPARFDGHPVAPYDSVDPTPTAPFCSSSPHSPYAGVHIHYCCRPACIVALSFLPATATSPRSLHACDDSPSVSDSPSRRLIALRRDTACDRSSPGHDTYTATPPMHRRPSVLSYRPKTSSALDDDSTSTPGGHMMKRTASQTFTASQYYDVRDTGVVLDAVNEAGAYGDYAASQHSHSSSLSRAISSVTGQFTRNKSRRRLSSASSAASAPRRRSSMQSIFEPLPLSSATRKPSIEHQRAPLQHQDSGIPAFPLQGQPQQNRSFLNKHFTGMRRRPAASGPSGEQPMVQIPYPSQPMPGAAARQAAAAANQDRHNQQRREQELDHTHRFLHGLLPASARDGDIKDNESGIDMTCASDTVRADSVTDKKMSMFITIVDNDANSASGPL